MVGNKGIVVWWDIMGWNNKGMGIKYSRMVWNIGMFHVKQCDGLCEIVSATSNSRLIAYVAILYSYQNDITLPHIPNQFRPNQFTKYPHAHELTQTHGIICLFTSNLQLPFDNVLLSYGKTGSI